jgi:hypothetical protein
MTFLHGSALTREIHEIVRTKSAVKIAVAYWGQDALKLTKVSTRRKNIRLLCCLKGGKSDPDIIKKFGKRIRQQDNLHAKVIWTSKRAVVSSANMSSNGLPEDEKGLRGLIEAGVVVTEPGELSKISKWFDEKYKSAKFISKDDLKKAKDARPVGGWGRREIKRSLIDALRNGGPREFGKQRIALALWKHFAFKADAKRFNYKLSLADKKVIRKSSRELWNKLGNKRKDEAGVIWLRDVAPILLRNAQ